jgi:hypothetical protein
LKDDTGPWVPVPGSTSRFTDCGEKKKEKGERGKAKKGEKKNTA